MFCQNGIAQHIGLYKVQVYFGVHCLHCAWGSLAVTISVCRPRRPVSQQPLWVIHQEFPVHCLERLSSISCLAISCMFRNGLWTSFQWFWYVRQNSIAQHKDGPPAVDWALPHIKENKWEASESPVGRSRAREAKYNVCPEIGEIWA